MHLIFKVGKVVDVFWGGRGREFGWMSRTILCNKPSRPCNGSKGAVVLPFPDSISLLSLSYLLGVQGYLRKDEAVYSHLM
jgi:hypothetical protein